MQKKTCIILIKHEENLAMRKYCCHCSSDTSVKNDENTSLVGDIYLNNRGQQALICNFLISLGKLP